MKIVSVVLAQSLNIIWTRLLKKISVWFEFQDFFNKLDAKESNFGKSEDYGVNKDRKYSQKLMCNSTNFLNKIFKYMWPKVSDEKMPVLKRAVAKILSQNA